MLDEAILHYAKQVLNQNNLATCRKLRGAVSMYLISDNFKIRRWVRTEKRRMSDEFSALFQLCSLCIADRCDSVVCVDLF